MRLVFAGTPQAAVPALDELLASRHEVVAVVTRPDAPAGRGLHEVPSPVAERAAQAGVEVLKPARVRDEEFLSRLRAEPFLQAGNALVLVNAGGSAIADRYQSDQQRLGLTHGDRRAQRAP